MLIHPLSSLLSAYGMGLADIRATRQQAIEVPLDAKRATLRSALKLGREARREVMARACIPTFRHEVHAMSAMPAPTRRCVLAVTLARRSSQSGRARAKPTNGGMRSTRVTAHAA